MIAVLLLCQHYRRLPLGLSLRVGFWGISGRQKPLRCSGGSTDTAIPRRTVHSVEIVDKA